MKRFSLLGHGAALCALLLAACGASRPAAPVPAAAVAPSAVPVPADDEIAVSGTLLPPMAVAVTSFGAAADARHLYVLGGYFGVPHEYSKEGQASALLRLPLSGSGGWQEVGRLEAGLQGLGVVQYRGKLCRFGGNRVANAAGQPEDLHSIAEAACFDPSTERWEALPDMPAGRSSHDAALVGDTVYIGGGWRLQGNASEGEWQPTLCALDLAKEGASWVTLQTPVRRRALALSSVGSQLLLIGGMDPDKQISKRVDLFDPKTGRWTQAPDFPGDTFGIAATALGDDVYASARDGMVYRFRLGERAWVPVQRLAFKRFFHRLVAAGPNTLIAVGGIDGMHTHGRTRQVERIELDRTQASVGTWSMPYPGKAKNRQAMFLEHDFLYLFGGNNSLEQHDFEPDNFVREGFRLHLPSMQWERIADYPAARQSMQTLQRQGEGIAIGGFGHDGTAAVSHQDAYRFDFAHGRFEARAGLPKGRTQFGLCEHGGQLWIFGGLNYDPRRKGASFDHVTSVLSTPAGAPNQAFAETGLNLPTPRRAFAGAVLGDTYYMIGGMHGEFELVSECSAFHFDTRRFESIPCPKAPRLSATLVPLGERLLLVGGSVQTERGVEPDRSIEAFDPATRRWHTILDTLPFDMRHARVLPYGGRLLIVSTQNDRAQIQLALVAPPP